MKDNKNDNLIEVDSSLLYECRFVILVEIAPQSNKYIQVPLSLDQFVEVSRFISERIGSKGVRVDNAIGNKIIRLPDTIRTCYIEKK